MRRQLLIVSVLLFVGITPVFAVQDSDMFPSSTALTGVTFPPVTAGPGYILPDSPFYFVDKLYQRVRLGLVFSAENKARLHNQIAGERLAELRVMMSRGNQVASDTALVELSHEAMASAVYLEDASAQGKDIKELAGQINDSMRQQREILQTVASQVASTGFGERMVATDMQLMEAKVKAEDSLSEDEREKEIARAVEEEMDKAILGVTSSTSKLEKRLERYEKLASTAAQKRLEKEKRQQVLQEYKARLEKLRVDRTKELERVKASIKEAQGALIRYRELQKQELDTLKSSTAL